MKEKFLTKEGVLTDFAFKVYLSEDELYFHKDSFIVNVYDVLKIKDIDKIIPDEIVINNFIFHCPEIDVFNLCVIYIAKDDSDISAIFKIDSNTFENGFNALNPCFQHFDISNEMFKDLDINQLENYL